MQALRIVVADEDLREELRKINSNSRLSELYLSLARDLDVMEARTPDEVCLYLRYHDCDYCIMHQVDTLQHKSC